MESKLTYSDKEIIKIKEVKGHGRVQDDCRDGNMVKHEFNPDIYFPISILELVVIALLMIVGAYLTKVVLANGFVEMNPISVLGVSSMGFIGYAFLRIVILMIIFIVSWMVSIHFSILWFTPLVLGILLIIFLIDDIHDTIVFLQTGINIGGGW